MNLSEFRSQYPAYNDIPDADLAKALHEKYYSDISFEDFGSQIGLKVEKPGIVSRAFSSIKDHLTQEREAPPDTASMMDAEYGGQQAERDPDAINMPGSVMDGYVPRQSKESVDIDKGLGPMRRDFYDGTKAALQSAPLSVHGAISQENSARGHVAAETLPGRLDKVGRRASGDTLSRTIEDVQDNAAHGTLPELSEKAFVPDREWGDAVKDVALSVGQFGLNLLQGTTWLADKYVPELLMPEDRAQRAIHIAGEWVKDLESDKSFALQARKAINQRIAGDGFFDTYSKVIADNAQDPALVADAIAQSIGYVIPSLAMAKGSATLAQGLLHTKAAQSYLANVGMKAATELSAKGANFAQLQAGIHSAITQSAGRIVSGAATAGAILGEGATSAIITGASIEDYVLSAKEKDLGRAPEYRALLSEHSPQEARKVFAKNLANTAAAKAGAWTSLISLGTGGGAFTGRVATGKQSITPPALAGGMFKESLQETLQNPGEDYAGFEARIKIDPSEKFDWARSAAEGTIVGFGQSAGMGGLSAAGLYTKAASGQSPTPPPSAPTNVSNITSAPDVNTALREAAQSIDASFSTSVGFRLETPITAQAGPSFGLMDAGRDRVSHAMESLALQRARERKQNASVQPTSGNAQGTSQGAQAESPVLPGSGRLDEQLPDAGTPDVSGNAPGASSDNVASLAIPAERGEAVAPRTGNPITVDAYHGSAVPGIKEIDGNATNQNRPKALDSDGVVWATSDEASATEYSAGATLDNQAPIAQFGARRGSVYRVRVSMQNPLVIDDVIGMTERDRAAVINYAKENGHDGVVLRLVTNTDSEGRPIAWDDSKNEYAVFGKVGLSQDAPIAKVKPTKAAPDKDIPPPLTKEAAHRQARQFNDDTVAAPHPTIPGMWALMSKEEADAQKPPQKAAQAEKPKRLSSEEWRNEGMTPEQIAVRDAEADAAEFAMQIENDSRDEDFAPGEIPAALRYRANDPNGKKLDLDSLRTALIAELKKRKPFPFRSDIVKILEKDEKVASEGKPVATKEPWQMTRAEFLRATVDELVAAGMARADAEAFGTTDVTSGTGITTGPNRAHADAVNVAIRDGQPVPTNVLADYPDLAASSPSEAAQDEKVSAGGTAAKSLPPDVERAALKKANEVQNEKDAFDIAEEIRSLEEGGGVDLSKLFENPKFWDSENEQWTPEGLEASANATRAQAIENLRLREITELSDLNLANHKAQYAAMLEILDGLKIPYTDTSSAQSKYIEVGGYKLRFADHANQVRDSAVRGSLPVLNVAPGESTFADALRIVMGNTPTANKPELSQGLPRDGMQERAVRADESGSPEPAQSDGAVGGARNIAQQQAEGNTETDTKETDKGVAMFSRSQSPLVNPHTADTLRTALGKAIGSDKFIPALEKMDKVRFVTSEQADKIAGRLMLSTSLTPTFKAVNTGSDGFRLWSRNATIKATGFKTGEPVVIRGYHGKLGGDIVGGAFTDQTLYTLSDDGYPILGKKRTGSPPRVFSMSTDAKLASGYAGPNAPTKGGTVIPVYISLSNPLVVDVGGPLHWADVPVPAGLAVAHENPRFSDSADHRTSTDHIAIAARKAGYDGVIFVDIEDSIHSSTGRRRGNTVMVFSPTQIKSAISNTGEFSSTNPDIRYSKSGRPLAFFNPEDGITYFIHDNIPATATKDELVGLLKHEVGAHALRLGRNYKEFRQILKDLEFRRKAGNKEAIEAFRRAENAEASEADMTEEALGYLVEAAPHSAIAKRFLAWFKTWVNKALGLARMHWKYTEADMAAMAQSALHRAPELFSEEMEYGGELALQSAQAPTFYSALIEAAEQIPAKLKTGNEIALWLQANTAKLNLKKEELHWSGVLDWLQTQGKVSKADVLEYLKTGGVRVNEDMLGIKGDAKERQNIRDKIYSIAERNDALGYDSSSEAVRDILNGSLPVDSIDVSQEDRTELRQLFDNAKKVKPGDNTKFSTYVPPGGKPGSYRELLLTLPTKEAPKPSVLTELPEGYDVIFDSKAPEGRQYGVTPPGQTHARPMGDRHATPEAAKIEALALVNNERLSTWVHERNKNSGAFRSSHFDQPNIIAHLRVDEVEGANGEKLLRVIEAQSDWGQKGRKEGFVNDDVRHAFDKWQRENPGESAAVWRARNPALVVAAQKEGAIPTAPFVTDTAAWLSLAIKKAISHAAENGFDGIVFATGEQQFKLWGSEEIAWVKDGDGWRINATEQVGGNAGGIDLEGEARARGILKENRGQRITSKEELLPIVKSVMRDGESDRAETIVDKVWKRMQDEPAGTSLPRKEGMEAFYDKIVPDAANKVLRQIGADTKVGEIEITGVTNKPSDVRYDVSKMTVGNANQPGFLLTDTIREKVSRKGLPLFSKSQNAVQDLNARIQEEGGLPDMFAITQFDDGGVSAAFTRAFGTPVTFIKPNRTEANGFMAMHWNGRIYVNPDNGKAGFVNLLGHELLHDIRKNNLGLYTWFMEKSLSFIRQGAEERYGKLLEAAGADMGRTSPLEEILADFVGDSLADPMFMDWLASQNKSKFMLFVGAVRRWFNSAIGRMTDAGLGSSEYITDVLGLQKYLGDMLNAYRHGKTAADIPAPPRNLFSKSQDGIDYARAKPAQLPPNKWGGVSAPMSIPQRWGAVSTNAPIHGLEVQRTFGQVLHDITATSKSFSWLRKHFGSQYGKALKDPDNFGRVFNHVDDYVLDTTLIATGGHELMPHIVPMEEKLRDIVKPFASRKDQEAAADALYNGTFLGGPSPKDGRVFTDEELRTARIAKGDKQFPAGLKLDFAPLSKKQIQVYREARAAIDYAVAELHKAGIWKIARKTGITREDFDGVSLEDAAAMAVEKLEEARDDALMSENQADADMYTKKIKDAQELAEEAQALIEHGYMPAMRFGDFAVTVKVPDKDGKMVTDAFMTFPLERQANLMKRLLEVSYKGKGAKVTVSMLPKESHLMFEGVSVDAMSLLAKHISIPEVDSTGNVTMETLEEDPVMQAWLDNALPQRSGLKHQIHRKGIAGFSRDLERILTKFLTGYARMASSTYHMTQAVEAWDNIPKEQADSKDEAAKLIEHIRDPKEKAAPVKGLMFFQLLGGDPTRFLINITQPVQTGMPWLVANGASTAEASKYLFGPEPKTQEYKDAFRKAREEGLTAPQELHQLMGVSRGSLVLESLPESVRASLPKWMQHMPHKVNLVWAVFQQISEQINRERMFKAAWKLWEKNGKQGDPMAFARKAINETQFVYGKHAVPNVARTTMGSIVMTYTQFPIMFIEMALRLPPKAAMLLLFILWAFAGAEGEPFAENLEDMVDAIGQWSGHATHSRQWLRDFIKDNGMGAGLEASASATLAEIILRGPVSALSGVDVGGRFSLGKLIPFTKALVPSEQDKGRELFRTIGPLGSIIDSATKATGDMFAGEMGKAIRRMAPRAFQNAVHGYQMLDTGEYRTMNDNLIAKDVTTSESVGKMIGLHPERIGMKSRAVQRADERAELVKTVQHQILNQWARAAEEGDDEGVRKARAKRDEWNAKNPDDEVRIPYRSLVEARRRLRRDADQRAIRRAPKQLRNEIREDLR